MLFSISTTHALRALAFLASRGREQALQGRDLARRARVPASYLTKVLRVLAKAGVLTATRGARGGYRLARPPERIRLSEVVLPLEGVRARPGCLLWPGRACNDSVACSAHESWASVNRTYSEFLEGTTLADIRPRPNGPSIGST